MCVITFDWEKNDAIKKFENFEKNAMISWCILDLTEYCNFNCKWCYANAGSVKNPVHMDIENLEKILDILANLGVRQITYSGGEPTLYPRLQEAICLARSRGMVVHMNTNGYLFTRDMAIELSELGLTQIQTNIDSIHAEKQDVVRGRRGSFENGLNALKIAREAGITAVSVTVLTKENESEAVEIFNLARSIGIQRCRVWDMAPANGCARENSQLLPKEFFSVVQKLSDFACETGAMHVEVGDPLFMRHVRTKLGISGGYCAPAAGMLMHVSARGDAYFCCASRNKMYNLLNELERGSNIRDVHREAINRFLAAFRKPDKCLGCEYESRCGGGCYTRRDFSRDKADYCCLRCSG